MLQDNNYACRVDKEILMRVNPTPFEILELPGCIPSKQYTGRNPTWQHIFSANMSALSPPLEQMDQEGWAEATAHTEFQKKCD